MVFVNRSHWSRWFGTSLASLLIVGASYTFHVPIAEAQDDLERSGAREAAGRGLDAYSQKRFADALDLFKRAESVVHAPTHLLYMARSAAELGQLVLARETYLKVVHEQLPANASNAFKEAKAAAATELAALEPRIPKLRIELQGDPKHAAQITLDGRSLSHALVGVAIPVDPGQHTLRATSAGMKPAETTIAVPESTQQVAELKLEAESVAAPATNVAPLVSSQSGPQPHAEEQRPNYLRIASYAAAGVGVIGLGVGTYFAFRAKSKGDDGDALYAKYECPNCSATQKDAVINSDDASASASTMSAVGFITGGVGIAAAVSLFVLSSGHSERAPNSGAAQVSPYVGPGAIGVFGRF